MGWWDDFPPYVLRNRVFLEFLILDLLFVYIVAFVQTEQPTLNAEWEASSGEISPVSLAMLQKFPQSRIMVIIPLLTQSSGKSVFYSHLVEPWQDLFICKFYCVTRIAAVNSFVSCCFFLR